MRMSEELLLAFIDGELSGPDREEVERALAADPKLRATVDEQRRLRTILNGHYGPVAQEDVPEKLLHLLGASRAEGAASLHAAREKRRAAPRPWQRYAAIAATLAVGIIAGQLLPDGRNGLIATDDGVLLAKGDLAGALETQLASAQSLDDKTRIGLTFADRGGRVCRTFEGPDLSGLACRAGGDWQVVLASASERKDSQFRQAGASVVLESAQEMMAGPPLDSRAEREAMEAGWNISSAPD